MIYLLFAYILNCFDYICTTYWVKKYDISIEGNPIGRWLYEYNIAWLFKIVIIGGLFCLIGYCYNDVSWAKYVAIAIFVVYLALAVYHIFLLVRLGQ